MKLAKVKDKIPGGLADDKPNSAFDPQQLAKGIKVEMEHTSDKSIAREIAKDHLTEDKNYYRKLSVMEGKSAKVKNPWAICNTLSEDTSDAKYERCVKKVKQSSSVRRKRLAKLILSVRKYS